MFESRSSSRLALNPKAHTLLETQAEHTRVLSELNHARAERNFSLGVIMGVGLFMVGIGIPALLFLTPGLGILFLGLGGGFTLVGIIRSIFYHTSTFSYRARIRSLTTQINALSAEVSPDDLAAVSKNQNALLEKIWENPKEIIAAAEKFLKENGDYIGKATVAPPVEEASDADLPGVLLPSHPEAQTVKRLGELVNTYNEQQDFLRNYATNPQLQVNSDTTKKIEAALNTHREARQGVPLGITLTSISSLITAGFLTLFLLGLSGPVGLAVFGFLTLSGIAMIIWAKVDLKRSQKTLNDLQEHVDKLTNLYSAQDKSRESIAEITRLLISLDVRPITPSNIQAPGAEQSQRLPSVDWDDVQEGGDSLDPAGAPPRTVRFSASAPPAADSRVAAPASSAELGVSPAGGPTPRIGTQQKESAV